MALDADKVAQRDGIFVSLDVAGETVWDELAESDPTHAVISAESEEAARLKSVEQIAEIARHVNESTVVLDLGCGYGRIAKYLLPHARIGGYIGADRAYAMLRLFKDRHEATPAEQTAPVLYVNSDIARLPLRADSVDLVVVSAVFLHNHKSIVREAMREVERVLRPGGKLLVFSSFPRRSTAMGLQGALYQAYLNARGDGTRNGPVRYYTRGEVEHLLERFSMRDLVPTEVELLPKSIIVHRGGPERFYRRAISNPVNRLFRKCLPRSFRRAFSRHYDVVATK